MKNVEFYAKELANLAVRGIGIGVRKNDGIPYSCSDLSCCDCLFYDDIHGCRDDENLLKWANSEHVEYEVDWSKVPVDTPVYCYNSEGTERQRSHFAKYTDCMVYVWIGGKTSFSIGDRDKDIRVISYDINCVQLAESHPEWMKEKERENK